MFKIFCDMDKVLTDFEGRFKELFKSTVAEYETEHGVESIWPLLNKHGIKFWANLPWTYDGHRLFNYIKKFNPTIISARPKLTLSTCVEPGKQIWIDRELGKHVPRHIGRRKDKVKQARFGYILIDDYDRTCTDWTNRGGIAIVHKSADETIRKLSQWLRDLK